MQINWDSFSIYNQDARGIRYKFEDMCRQLFALENLAENKNNRYLHSEHNNPGIETEPIFDETNKRWIGFQAKFFDSKVDYSQIEHSAQKTVEYYTGKVELVYLFCNKPLKKESLGRTYSILEAAEIELQLITDTAILDLVHQYPHIGLYYFGNHTINSTWFHTHSQHMYEVLGERYNKNFNVETDYWDELSFFIHDQRAVDNLNSRKTRLLSEISELYWKYGEHCCYLTRETISLRERKAFSANSSTKERTKNGRRNDNYGSERTAACG